MRYLTIERNGSHVGAVDFWPSAVFGCRERSAGRLRAVSKQANLSDRLLSHTTSSRFAPAGGGLALAASSYVSGHGQLLHLASLLNVHQYADCKVS